MRFPATPGWGPPFVVVAGPLPLLAEGPRVWCPATPGCGPPPAMVGGPSPLLAEGRGCGSPPLLAGVRWLWWWGFARHSWLGAPGAAPRLLFLAGACLWRWCGGVVRVCWCAVLWLAAPALLCGPGVCVCVCVLSGASCWCGWCAGFVCGVLAVCVCVCVRCVICGVCHTWFGLRRRPTWSR